MFRYCVLKLIACGECVPTHSSRMAQLIEHARGKRTELNDNEEKRNFHRNGFAFHRVCLIDHLRVEAFIIESSAVGAFSQQSFSVAW